MTVLTLFAFRFGRMVRRLAGRGARGGGAVVRGGLETRGDGLSAGCGAGSEPRRAGACGAGA